jgi:hypothetical protein
MELISDSLPFGRLWYGEPNANSNSVDYAKFRSRSHDAVIRVPKTRRPVPKHGTRVWCVFRTNCIAII